MNRKKRAARIGRYLLCSVESGEIDSEVCESIADHLCMIRQINHRLQTPDINFWDFNHLPGGKKGSAVKLSRPRAVETDVTSCVCAVHDNSFTKKIEEGWEALTFAVSFSVKQRTSSSEYGRWRFELRLVSGRTRATMGRRSTSTTGSPRLR